MTGSLVVVISRRVGQVCNRNAGGGRLGGADPAFGAGGKGNALRFPARCGSGSGGLVQPNCRRTAPDLEGEKRPPGGGPLSAIADAIACRAMGRWPGALGHCPSWLPGCRVRGFDLGGVLVRADQETHRVSPSAATKVQVDWFSMYIKGQRPSRRARSARRGRDGRWPGLWAPAGRVDEVSRGRG